jgi:hypothetical protein
MKPIIEVVVAPTGEVRIETKGFAGATCQEASRFVEIALGKKGREQLTTGYFQQNSQGESVQETR